MSHNGKLTDHGYSGNDVCHYLQGVRSTKFKAVVNVVHAQPGKDFDATMSYLGQMVTNNINNLQ